LPEFFPQARGLRRRDRRRVLARARDRQPIAGPAPAAPSGSGGRLLDEVRQPGRCSSALVPHAGRLFPALDSVPPLPRDSSRLPFPIPCRFNPRLPSPISLLIISLWRPSCLGPSHDGAAAFAAIGTNPPPMLAEECPRLASHAWRVQPCPQASAKSLLGYRVDPRCRAPGPMVGRRARGSPRSRRDRSLRLAPCRSRAAHEMIARSRPPIGLTGFTASRSQRRSRRPPSPRHRPRCRWLADEPVSRGGGNQPADWRPAGAGSRSPSMPWRGFMICGARGALFLV